MTLLLLPPRLATEQTLFPQMLIFWPRWPSCRPQQLTVPHHPSLSLNCCLPQPHCTSQANSLQQSWQDDCFSWIGAFPAVSKIIATCLIHSIESGLLACSTYFQTKRFLECRARDLKSQSLESPQHLFYLFLLSLKTPTPRQTEWIISHTIRSLQILKCPDLCSPHSSALFPLH